MLQQTRVSSVQGYFRRFVSEFPTVRALAKAPISQVLAAWSGLGYYGRARHLHRAAREVVHRGGRLPRTSAELRTLPGFGPYTAGAVASIAFGQQVPAVDGNVTRVLSRWHGWTGDIEAPWLRARSWERAAELVPAVRPGDWNEALMELGATICTPRDPACLRCPLRRACAARRSGDPGRFGLRAPKGAVPRILRWWAVVSDIAGRVALVRRPASGLWGGLYEPVSGHGRASATAVRRAVSRRLGVSPMRVSPPARRGSFRHLFTHRDATFHVWACRLPGRGRKAPGVRWASPTSARRLGLPSPARRLLLDYAA